MSGLCFGAVLMSYPGGGGDFKLALALGDSADDEGYVYIETTLDLLHRARLTEQGFVRALAQMKSKGWLTVVDANECLYQLKPPGVSFPLMRGALRPPKLSLVS